MIQDNIMSEENQPGQNEAMTPEELPHKPADDREQIYFEGPPVLRSEIGKLSLAGLIALVLLVIPVLFHRSRPGMLPWWATLALVVIAILVVVVPILIQKTRRYRITNYRIDYERGVLSKNIDTLELWHVEDIQFHQSLLDRILGIGMIRIMSRDETTPELLLAGIPNPRPVFESLKQRIIAVKRQRGVVKMDIGN
jgi:membrane protein YdbS with pleckstrin-like domain